MDMIKDISETMYYCSVVEAMEKAEEEQRNGNGNTVYYTERYLPMYSRYLDNSRERENPRDMGGNDRVRYAERGSNSNGNSSGGGRYYDMNRYHEIPYYDYMEPIARDLREGRSPVGRRRYMESKEGHQAKEVQIQELEKYMGELSQDITEMIADSTPEEKKVLHDKLSALTNKVELLMK